MQREDIKMLVKKWRDIYEDESLDYKNFSSNVIAQPLIKALSEAGVVEENNAPSAA
jgi:inositol 3-alpha-galactosyltransferase